MERKASSSRQGVFCLVVVSMLLIPVASTAEDGPYNYGAVWNGWSPQSRSAYLWGYKDGNFAAYWLAGKEWLKDEFLSKPESPRVKQVREKLFLVFDGDAIAPVMTTIYKDPANTFVDLVDAARLSRDKLKGEDIEPGLLAARRKAIRNYENEQKAKSRMEQ